MLVNYDGAGSDGSGTAGRARLVPENVYLFVIFGWNRFKQEYEDCLKKPEQYFLKHLRYHNIRKWKKLSDKFR